MKGHENRSLGSDNVDSEKLSNLFRVPIFPSKSNKKFIYNSVLSIKRI